VFERDVIQNIVNYKTDYINREKVRVENLKNLKNQIAKEEKEFSDAKDTFDSNKK
jgi:hypothetical protein